MFPCNVTPRLSCYQLYAQAHVTPHYSQDVNGHLVRGIQARIPFTRHAGPRGRMVDKQVSSGAVNQLEEEKVSGCTCRCWGLIK